MKKRGIKILMVGLIALSTIQLECKCRYGDRYEWGKIYAEKETLKAEIDELHTEKQLAEWQKYRCCYGYCEDDAQNDVRKIPSQPGRLHLHEQCRNNAWVPVIRDRGYWVEVIQKDGKWIPVETPKPRNKTKM